MLTVTKLNVLVQRAFLDRNHLVDITYTSTAERKGEVRDGFKVDWVNGLNTHLHDAHIYMDRLKFVFFRIYKHVKMCRKQN